MKHIVPIASILLGIAGFLSACFNRTPPAAPSNAKSLSAEAAPPAVATIDEPALSQPEPETVYTDDLQTIPPKFVAASQPPRAIATTKPLAPNGLPYQYQWSPPGPKPTSVYYGYAWMPDSQGSEFQGWWLMPNGQPAVQPVTQQSSCSNCGPRGLFWGRR